MFIIIDIDLFSEQYWQDNQMAVKKMFNVLRDFLSEGNSGGNYPVPDNIERIAIDQRGFLGTMYDGYTDNIKGKLNIEMKSESHKLKNHMKCILIEGRKPDTRNLLKFIDIDHQLRLSIELKLVPATGIALLVSYSRSINAHTRFLYVYHETGIQSYGNRLHELRKPVTSSASETCATHIITGIVYGIHLLVILQLPPDHEKEIDILLLKMYPSLCNNGQAINMNSKDRALLNQIISTTVYSNIGELTRIKKFDDVYDKIIELQKNDTKHRSLKYVLTPIQWFYGQYHELIPLLHSCEPHESEILEYYLLQQSSEFKVLMLRITHDLPELLQGKLEKQLENIKNELFILHTLLGDEFVRNHNLLCMIRHGDKRYSIDNNKVSLDPPKEIQRVINDINIHINELESKVKFIKQLQINEFDYCDVAELGIREGLNEETVKDILFGNDTHKAIFFSTDTLRKQNQEDWIIIYSKMIEEHRTNPQLRLVYADFTYSPYTLTKITIERLTESTVNRDQSNLKPSQSYVKRKAPPPPTLSLPDECINILLLGESGVGKSTFINAFANYLRFQSLEEAQQGKPIVVIPVSYVMAVNDNFEERIIKFGGADSNENHNDFGESVTQQCKSYVFNIFDKKKLRIIDTPGFGDTRGDHQDDLNMEEIFSFLNNFTYLNGICLLFKPETAQLNPYFRSCCTQLFDYFGENIRDHLMFCFTNARSTFFAPGNTRPLLNTFFESFPVKRIPFEKANTFSFDSESFRYLIAIQDSIQFDQIQKSEFEQGWKKSVAESKRFREFLCNQDAYRKNDQWQSIKDAQFQINYMIRPLLETMRNLFRNGFLCNANSSVKLYATHVEPSLTICYSCNRKNPQRIGQFWILGDHLHHSPNTVSFKSLV